MEIIYFEVFLMLLFVSTLYLSNTFAQGSYTQWSLPEGAKMRLGKGEANAIEYSPDGTFLAVASDIGIWLYDTNNDEELKLFIEHTDSIHNISFSPDGKTLANVERGGTICLWNVLNGEVKLKFPGYWLWNKDEYGRDYELKYRHEYGKDESIRDISFSPNGKTLAIVGRYAIYLTETAELLNLQDADSVHHYTDYLTKTIEWMLIHTDGIVSASFSPDGQTLASVDRRTIRLWDVLTGTVKQAFETSYGSSVLFSPDGQTLASVSRGKILLWNIVTGTVKQEFTRDDENDENRIESISFSPDGQTLASGYKYDICLWDVSTGTVKQVIGERTIAGSSYRCVSLSFSPDGKMLAGICRNIRMESPIYIWDVLNGKLERSLEWHTKSVSSVSFSPDGKMLLTKGTELLGGNFLWDVSTGMVKREYYIHYAMFSPDGQTLAVGGCGIFGWLQTFRCLMRGIISPYWTGAQAIWLLDLLSGKRKRVLIGHRSYINDISFSPDGQMLASIDGKGTIRLWDILKGKTKQKLRGYYNPLFSPNGKTLAIAYKGDIHLWDISTKKVKRKLTGHDSVANLLFSPDGKTLASIDGCDHSVWLWDVSTGEVRLTHDQSWGGRIDGLSFSPDGSMLASGNDYTIHLWDTSTGTVEQELIGHTDTVYGLSFSPDGSMLASGGFRGTVLLWDVSAGEIMQEFIGHTRTVESVSFSPDGKMLASGSWDGTVLLWDVPSQ